MSITFLLHVLAAWAFISFSRMVSLFTIRVTVEGTENMPLDEPLIVTANHFSWFDAPLVTMYLPVRPVFMIATESQRFFFVRWFMKAFDGVPIWRGRVDRQALNRALNVLDSGKCIAIFPEGGINPKYAEVRDDGKQIVEHNFYNSFIITRNGGELTHPQPGTAYIATQSQARVLPVALVGTENILMNLIRFRRTPVTIKIGEPYGPLGVASTLEKREQRRALHGLAEQIMYRIAKLFPHEKRGPYQNFDSETPV